MNNKKVKKLGKKYNPTYIYNKVQANNKYINKGRSFKVTSTIKRLWWYFKDSKWLLMLILFFNLCATSLEVTGMYYTGYIYDQFLMKSDIDWTIKVFAAFALFCSLLLILYSIGHLLDYLAMSITIRISEKKVCFRLRRDIINKIQTLPVKYFDANASGELITKTSSDVDNIAIAINQYVNNTIFWTFLIIAIIITMFLINPALAAITLIAFPIMSFITNKAIKFITPYFKKQQKEVDKLNAFVEERVSGTKIVSLYQKEQLNIKEFKDINDRLTKNSIVANTTSNMMMPINNFFNNISFVILTCLGISLVALDYIKVSWGLLHYESMSSLLIIFTIFARNLTNPISQISLAFGPISLALTSANRIFEILDQEDEKDEKGAKDIKNVKGYVRAEHLNFAYDSSKMILKDINFESKPNHTTALVGPTGAGKTTIVSLITKFYGIHSGNLYIDNIPINKITAKSLRQNITMVLQDTFLFSNTIRENIRYGRINATDAEVEAAAKLANADNFIRQLPLGYETIIDDNGMNLSQGQRQLLAISRAFLADSKIVILDEATSNIDTKTEADIQVALEKLMKNRTSFIIAHRLSTIKNADNILVLNDGQIIEHGNHNQLLKKNGFYAKLYNSQFN